MVRLPRFCPAGIPQHIVQRGNNRTACFLQNKDFAVYAKWLSLDATQHRVAIHAWVFMSNHVHLLATPHTADGISLMMQSLGRRYVRYFNKTHNRTGTLWEGRYRSSTVQSEAYLLACYRYIELNPVRAEMVAHAGDYPWSSYRFNAFGGESSLCTPHEVYLNLGKDTSKRQANYRRFCDADSAAAYDDEIRESLKRGHALGNASFRRSLETTYGRQVAGATMGRPRKKKV